MISRWEGELGSGGSRVHLGSPGVGPFFTLDRDMRLSSWEIDVGRDDLDSSHMAQIWLNGVDIIAEITCPPRKDSFSQSFKHLPLNAHQHLFKGDALGLEVIRKGGPPPEKVKIRVWLILEDVVAEEQIVVEVLPGWNDDPLAMERR